MKKVKVEEAVGMTLAHDITEIIPGQKKDVAFQKGRVIETGDVERLKDLGKNYLYIFDGDIEGVHENEAATRIARAIMDEHMDLLPPKEGKVSITSKVDGLFYVKDKTLYEMNRIKDVLVSTVPNRYPVKAGDTVAAARIVPLYIDEKGLEMVERVGEKGVIAVRPFKPMKVGLVITGNEVFSGRVQDGSSVVVDKLKGYGLEFLGREVVPDGISAIRDSILGFLKAGADIVITTAGLSVDPDDVTREGIEETGAKVLFYGTPVFPGAMFLVSRLKGKYILGAPACVYYNNYTALDIVLPRIMAGERIHRNDMVKLSYGGLCLHCEVCHYPRCFFGKGP